MTNAVIGALRVNLGLDSAQFSKGLKTAQSSTDRFSKMAKTAFAAVGVAALGMAAAFATGVRSTLNEADKLAKMSQKIGIPVEELSKLKYAADLSGVSLEGISTSVGRLSRNMFDAAQGTGEGAKGFKMLGINVKNADGSLKSSTQVMTEMADRFKTMPDGAAKTALAMQLMGRSGAEMIPLLNGGSEALGGLLSEAKQFGLEISTETARAAEVVNDNFARVGYAINGVQVSLTAALAPALVAVSQGMVNLATSFVDALAYLPVLAEYAAVAGGALALMASPAIVGAVTSLAVAIGTGLVGAVKLLTAVIMANPLGALAVGIAIAVTAIYHFRDEIQKAIGVDVVGIAKNAGNLLIGSFVAAFEDIKFVWKNFPAVIGSAVIGATNLVIKAVNMMVNVAKTAINDLISTINLVPGVDIGQLDTSSGAIGEMANPFSAAMETAIGARNAAVGEAMSRDYIGEIGAAFSGATPAAMNFGAAVGGVNDALESLGGGGGKGGKKGKDGAAKKAADELKRMAEAMESARESLGQGFGSVLEGLINKTMTWKDALIQAGQAVLRYFNQANLAQGGKGLFGGGFLQGIMGSLLGFRANGGPVASGMPYIVGERGPELMIPNTSGTVVSNRNLGAGGKSNYAPVYNIDARGADQAAVARMEAGLRERDRLFAKQVTGVNHAQQLGRGRP